MYTANGHWLSTLSLLPNSTLSTFCAKSFSCSCSFCAVAHCCQTALYKIAEALVRWIAPILSFTAQEAWEQIPGKRDEFVFTQFWYDKLEKLDESSVFNSEFWQRMLTFRNEANKAIETACIMADNRL